jgi:hypothetical protein
VLLLSVVLVVAQAVATKVQSDRVGGAGTPSEAKDDGTWCIGSGPGGNGWAGCYRL